MSKVTPPTIACQNATSKRSCIPFTYNGYNMGYLIGDICQEFTSMKVQGRKFGCETNTFEQGVC